MTLTPGYYKTRDGRKARVLCVDAPGEYPCVGFIGQSPNIQLATWAIDGIYDNSFCDEDCDDLIAPWTEPKPKKKIELRRALSYNAWNGGPEKTYWVGWYDHHAEKRETFIRWLDEDPLVIEVDGE